jgi:hypothetical protein
MIFSAPELLIILSGGVKEFVSPPSDTTDPISVDIVTLFTRCVQVPAWTVYLSLLIFLQK